MGHAQHRPRAVDEQGPQVHVTVLGHRAETLFAAAGMLTWRESQLGRELAPVAEHFRVADTGHDGRRGDRPHALHLHQPLHRFARPRQRCDALASKFRSPNSYRSCAMIL